MIDRKKRPESGPTKKRNSFREGKTFDPDFQLKKNLRGDVMEFLADGEAETLAVPPMNSYHRRIVHEIAKDFNLESSSEGEGEQRHNVLKKKEGTYRPSKSEIEEIKRIDHGDKEFFVVADPDGVEVSLFQDGSFGIGESSSDREILDRKVISSGSFKIKDRRILDFHDVEW